MQNPQQNTKNLHPAMYKKTYYDEIEYVLGIGSEFNIW